MDRWDKLFAHLEAEQELIARDERAGTADQVREAEVRALHLADRLRAHCGQELRILTDAGQFLQGCLSEVHEEWILLTASHLQYLIVAKAIVAYFGLTAKSQKAEAVGETTVDASLKGALNTAGNDAMSRLKARTARQPEKSFSQKLREIALQQKPVSTQTVSARFEGVFVAVLIDHLTIKVQVSQGEGADQGAFAADVSVPLEKVLWVRIPGKN